MKREELIAALGNLGYPLVSPSGKRFSAKRIMEILGELALSREPRLIEGFPVILSTCAQMGLHLDLETFLSQQSRRSRKQRNLERLLLVSYALLDQENLKEPEGLTGAVESLQDKYADSLLEDEVVLEGGVSLSTERLRNALRTYMRSREANEKRRTRQRQLFQRDLNLSAVFSPKQKELVVKKLEGKPLTKTEREYYSRVVRKKLEALADSEVRKIARVLTSK